jgi:hypothetical protein
MELIKSIWGYIMKRYLSVLQIIVSLFLIWGVFVLFFSEPQYSLSDEISRTFYFIDIIKSGFLSVISILMIILIELFKHNSRDNS